MKKELILLFLFFTSLYDCFSQVEINAQFNSNPSPCKGSFEMNVSIVNLSKSKRTLEEVTLVPDNNVLLNEAILNLQEGVKYLGNGRFSIEEIAPCDSISFLVAYSIGACYKSNDICVSLESFGYKNQFCSEVVVPEISIVDKNVVAIGKSKFKRNFKLINTGSDSLKSIYIQYSEEKKLYTIDRYNIGKLKGSVLEIASQEFVAIGNNNSTFDPGESIFIEQEIEIPGCLNDVDDYISVYMVCDGFPCVKIAEDIQNLFDLSSVFNGPNLNIGKISSSQIAMCDQVILDFYAVGNISLTYRDLSFNFEFPGLDMSKYNVDSIVFPAAGIAIIDKESNNFSLKDKSFTQLFDQLDSDGLYNDLRVSDTLFIRIYVSILDVNIFNGRINSKFQIFYENQCGDQNFGFYNFVGSDKFKSELQFGKTELEIVNGKQKRSIFKGDSLRMSLVNTIPGFGVCDSSELIVKIRPPDFMEIYGDSIFVNNGFERILDEDVNSPFFGLYIAKVKELKFPYEKIGDTIKISIVGKDFVSRNISLHFIVKSGLSADSIDDCVVCQDLVLQQFEVFSTLSCKGGCFSVLTYSADKNNNPNDLVISYDSRRDKNRIDRPIWNIDSSFILLKNGIFSDYTGTSPIDEGINNVLVELEPFTEVVVVTGGMSTCIKKMEDSIFFNAIYSNKESMFSSFDPSINLNLKKSNGIEMNAAAFPQSISTPLGVIYGMSSNVEIFEYNITGFLFDNNFTTGDTLYITRNLRSGQNNLAVITNYFAHEIRTSSGNCTQKYGRKLEVNFNVVKPAFETILTQFNYVKPILDSKIVLKRFKDNSVLFNLSYLAKTFTGVNSEVGSQAFVICDSLTFKTNARSTLEFSNLNIVLTDEISTLIQSKYGNNISYTMSSLPLVDKLLFGNFFRMPVRFLHLYNQSETIDFNYFFRQRNLKNSSIYQSKKLSTSLELESIKFYNS